MKKNDTDDDTVNRILCKDISVSDPKTRLKILSNHACDVTMDHNIPPKRYYRSGIQLLRMANSYIDDGEYEDAYVLYMKFITIFVEKIRDHPLYHTVPRVEKAKNQEALREVITKAEELKKQLLSQYQAEFEKYLEEVKEKELADKERRKREEHQRLKEEEERKKKLATLAALKTVKELSGASANKEDLKILSEDNRKTLYPQTDNVGQPSREKKTPFIDRSTKPATTTNDTPKLRDIVLPNELLQKFLTLAFTNTANNKETCGIIAGRLDRNKLLVTHLLIPQQTGSPDSCATHNEEDIFDYQDRHNLFTLGWIHTHPTQTAFLSSVDLHTHCAYQLMMAEAIAIVCAPKYDETGFFILTPQYGLEFIASCTGTGFHPHPTEPPLYTKATHCKLDFAAGVVVVDLRRQ
ncbi:STAM-binding protein-like A isoform X2 [Prorops nasuta]|uniref:STAM-binding protein-like A isoform X2 n=1 Tax=Prorops nasuta TaxID=863751 RepID=UPI0034CF5E12